MGIISSIPVSWIVGIAIVVVGLFVLGFRDVMQFSLRRVWAISSVAFAESIRRRILWITPLAIVGIIVVSQLQRPTDEADAIRQTLKVCLFATGLVVTLSAMILAATNLPREIDNRVIYTIVTKPTTRLEIVLGKILGFARVSALILLIMGLFTYGYLRVREWKLRQQIAVRLDMPEAVSPAARPVLEQSRDQGLLVSRSLAEADDVSFFSRLPDRNDPLRWIAGGAEQDVLIPFDLGAGLSTQNGLVLLISAPYEVDPNAPPEEMAEPVRPELGPMLLPVPSGLGKSLRTAQVLVQILDENHNPVVPANMINNGDPIVLPLAGSQEAQAFVPANALSNFPGGGRIYVQLVGTSKGVEYAIKQKPVRLLVPGTDQILEPATDASGQTALVFRGRSGYRGQQLRGQSQGESPVAVYSFRDVAVEENRATVPVVLRVNVERSGSEDPSAADDLTQLWLQVQNPAGRASEPVLLNVESERPTQFMVPASALQGGDFDILLRSRSDGRWLNLRPDSIQLVRSQSSFVGNLGKSLLILWLLSLLVVMVAVFASTFVSWPIAVVLTLMILLGHWGVQQLGDATAPGIGNQVANDFGFKRPAEARVISQSVETLTRLLRVVSSILPDVSQFAAIEDIERGLTIPAKQLLSALKVIGGFGIPLTVLAYVFLKNKEVAP